MQHSMYHTSKVHMQQFENPYSYLSFLRTHSRPGNNSNVQHIEDATHWYRAEFSHGMEWVQLRKANYNPTTLLPYNPDLMQNNLAQGYFLSFHNPETLSREVFDNLPAPENGIIKKVQLFKYTFKCSFDTQSPRKIRAHLQDTTLDFIVTNPHFKDELRNLRKQLKHTPVE